MFPHSNAVLNQDQPNNCFESVYKVLIPKGTTIYEGPVGYQGGAYLGGQNVTQIFVEQPWQLKGVGIMDSWPLR